tara:strand:+ start:393 stop:752 length:360 start_codon:yes stop_codon:yes gene_type:complete
MDNLMSKAMELLLWGRSREALPLLTKPEWRVAAATCYRNAIVETVTQGGTKLWERLVCGALTARAISQGWDDLASQYHSRYWSRVEGGREGATRAPDSDADLGVAMTYVVDIEDSYRAL